MYLQIYLSKATNLGISGFSPIQSTKYYHAPSIEDQYFLTNGYWPGLYLKLIGHVISPLMPIHKSFYNFVDKCAYTINYIEFIMLISPILSIIPKRAKSTYIFNKFQIPFIVLFRF